MSPGRWYHISVIIIMTELDTNSPVVWPSWCYGCKWHNFVQDIIYRCFVVPWIRLLFPHQFYFEPLHLHLYIYMYSKKYVSLFCSYAHLISRLRTRQDLKVDLLAVSNCESQCEGRNNCIRKRYKQTVQQNHSPTFLSLKNTQLLHIP